jgi:hypothetical protein
MAAARAVLAAAAAALLAGCVAAHPFVVTGDTTTVQIGYSGDVASAWPVARQYCASYGRIPRLAESDAYNAYFDCVGK